MLPARSREERPGILPSSATRKSEAPMLCISIGVFLRSLLERRASVNREPLTVVVPLRLRAPTYAAVQRIADQEDRPVSVALRRLIEQGLAQAREVGGK